MLLSLLVSIKMIKDMYYRLDFGSQCMRYVLCSRQIFVETMNAPEYEQETICHISLMLFSIVVSEK